MLTPRLEVLPAPQRRLWDELAQTPKDFVLYGGTALVLRLGHRSSEDFDFFSSRSFAPAALQRVIPYLMGAETSQSEANTLTVIVDRNGPVKVSFFGGLKLNRVEDPEPVSGKQIRVASLVDVAATKMVTIQQRACAKDYLDIVALADAGVSLSAALGAAGAVYGRTFNGVLSLKALTYFADGDLQSLSPAVQTKLRNMANEVDFRQIQPIKPKGSLSGEGDFRE
ncbi:MAG TPA: nucleotidyl transferase AbiEii/AbiGii toxin family protein [Terriglobales bacterium]|nr:nucleotidyl transferase AbiEii/AbiGii toxin family protein [Terriglobales bacterium]